MSSATASVVVKGPREEVFALFADREGYGKLVPPVSGTLLQPGETERQGKGAVHRVGIGSVGFREQIVAIDPGHSFTYSMLSRVPVRRWIGRVAFYDDPQGTRVDYTLDIEARLPVPGAVVSALARGMAAGLGRGAGKRLRRG